jgi:serine/threonine-protein kinase
MGDPATHPVNEEPPTIAEPAASSRSIPEAASGPTSASEPTGSRVTSVITPRETLHLQEVARTRVFATVVSVFAVFVLGTLALVGGDPFAKRILAGSLVAIGATCLWLRWQLRKDEGYTVTRATVAAYICILGAFTGIWFFGVFSPAPIILLFGLAFFSIGQSARAVFAVYLTCAALQLGLMVLVASGLLPDQGLIRASRLTFTEEAIVILLVQAVLFVTFLVQRRTRDVTIQAIEQHDRVLRTLAHRDALLREARQDLAVAMQAGGMGRWTDEVLGSFRLGRVLGRGAMGEVYEAVRVGSARLPESRPEHRTTTDEQAAVKLLHPHVLAQPDLVQRFLREARIVASLNAANVVRVLEVSPPDARVPWLAMELLTGHDLADHLREHKRMGVKSALTMLRQVGLGLDAARGAGVVHRDLKPRNLFLSSRGDVWKILDFGVARLAGEETLTKDQIVGTPNYMAPEQANGAPVTHKTDLFALGAIAYRALTGRPAFEGEATAEIVYKVVHGMPPQPSEVAPLPSQIDLVLAIAMAKDPADRFESAAEFAQAVDAASRGRLDAALRARAERLLSRLPWGTQQ